MVKEKKNLWITQKREEEKKPNKYEEAKDRERTIGNGRVEKAMGGKVETVPKFKYFHAPFNHVYPACTKEKKWKNIIKVHIGCHLTESKVGKKYWVKVSFPFRKVVVFVLLLFVIE